MALTTLQGTNQSGDKKAVVEWAATTSDPTVTTNEEENEKSVGTLKFRLEDDTRFVDFKWPEGQKPSYEFGSV